MRIGVYDPYLDDCGGGEKYMLTLASGLSVDHDVFIFWNNPEDLKNAAERFSINVEKIKIAGNIFSPKIGLFKRLSESRKFDVIIVLSDGSIPVLLSKKLFVHVQQPIPVPDKSLKTRLKLKKVNRIFVNSCFTKGFVDRQLGVDSVVAYPPVELHPKKVEKENIILHVGRFRIMNNMTNVKDYKKQEVMIKTFVEMYKNGLKNWKFIMAVSVREEDMTAFEDLKKKAHGVPIEFLLNEPNMKLWDTYSRAKIYWHASGYGEDLEKHPEYAEHFGISTVEAMGANCVPVVINAGGQKEIVEDNISGFLWNSLEELKEKTLTLTREDKILENMSKEAHKRSKNFTREQFGEEIKRLVENG